MKGMHSPIVFVMPFYAYFKAGNRQNYKNIMYSSGEMAVQLEEDITGLPVFIYAGSALPQDFFELFLLLDTIKKHNPKEITLVMPFLWFSRFDGADFLWSQGLSFLLNQLAFYGISKIITFDIHNKEYINFYMQQKINPPIVHEILHENVWGNLIAEYKSKGFSVAFPDEGAAKRYLSYIKKEKSFVTLKKQRKDEDVFVIDCQGSVSKKIILIDDILYSGKTLLEACKVLKELGALEIVVIVSHGFFVGKAWQDLFNCGVQVIHVSNSLPYSEKIKHPFIKVHNISSFL